MHIVIIIIISVVGACITVFFIRWLLWKIVKDFSILGVLSALLPNKNRIGFAMKTRSHVTRVDDMHGVLSSWESLGHSDGSGDHP